MKIYDGTFIIRVLHFFGIHMIIMRILTAAQHELYFFKRICSLLSVS
jgi:hypothetical protein